MAESTLSIYKKPALLTEWIDLGSKIAVNTTYSEKTKDVSKEGYIPVAVVGRMTQNGTGGSNVSWVHWQTMYLDGNTLHYAVNRHTSGSATIQLSLEILYVNENSILEMTEE